MTNHPFLGKNEIWAVRTNSGKMGETHPAHIVLRLSHGITMLNFSRHEAIELAIFLASSVMRKWIAQSREVPCLAEWVDRDRLQLSVFSSKCLMLVNDAKIFSDRILKVCVPMNIVRAEDPAPSGARHRMDENLRSVFG